MRVFFGALIGTALSVYLYGEKIEVVDPKVAMILEDDESMQYAHYMKSIKRDSTKNTKGSSFYPGKISD